LCIGILAVCLLMGADQVGFKTIRARDAKIAYDEALKKAQGEYNEKVLTARKNYRMGLDAAKAQVMQSGDLDEANKLAAEVKKLDQEIKEGAVPPTMRGMLIRRAKFGIDDKWADVTDIIRHRLLNNAIVGMGDLPDPAFGKNKTLVLEGMYGGKDFVLSFNLGRPGTTFVFGMPSEELKVPR